MAEAVSAQTLDAFHRGDFHLVQPKGAGHRAGVDAMMLAASVPSAFAGRLADFGAGAGAAGLAVASRCPRAEVLLVEAAPQMAHFARLTLDHPTNAHLAGRASLLVADVTLAGRARAKAGLADGAFDFVIMNPPFNAARDRPSPDALKQMAHVMEDGLFEKWIRSAAAVVRPRGWLAVIARPPSLPPILAALAGRFGSAEILPVHARAGSAAIRVVVRARRASRGALSLVPPLVLHDGPGDGFSARADAINNGRASLFGD
ncbi:tRNA1(Val) (adenine(37)-N6)-methyltransferase [Mesorhizobium marinum]|uniref:tRNA1(Val) (Adenine(37)-N6)-methyltransferase n=1 Tax=Mesorhizobium marinum TaxID=3228790 RepID=A0ABV3R2C9_9HYPH